MKDKILKIAGVKTEKQFYKKFPSEEAFMKMHGKAFKKAQMGTKIDTAQVGTTLPDFEADAPTSNPVVDNALSKMGSASPDILGNLGGIAGVAGTVGGIAKGLSALKAEKQKVKSARQWQGVSDVSLAASRTRDVDANRMNQQLKVRPEDIKNTGEEFFPIYGVGTNVLARNGVMLQNGGPVGGTPTEIQNTYGTGHSIYDDGGYEPLSDSEIVKQYRTGGLVQAQNGKGLFGGNTDWMANTELGKFAGNSGGDITSSLVTGATGENAGGDIGGSIGGALGSAIGGPVGGLVGKVGGKLIGSLLDKNPQKIKKAQDATKRNVGNMAFNQNAQALQTQNQSYMENGGWMNPEYNPQVIAKFGDHSPQDVYDFAHEGMQSLRAGGHLQSYTPPSEQAMETYAMGGELQTHWGGHAQPISQNPYLPDGGETVMFRGNSHEERSPNGETGIGVTYGNNPVEVERGEPAVKLQDGGSGGDSSLVVYGNLQIPKYGAEMLNDPKAKNKKFKNYVADLSKSEVKYNKILDKSSGNLKDLDVRTPIDQLKLSALHANLMGGNMHLKNIADKKQDAAHLQQAINDTAEEHGIIADDLARNKITIDKEAQKQYAKFGGNFEQAGIGTWLAKGLDKAATKRIATMAEREAALVAEGEAAKAAASKVKKLTKAQQAAVDAKTVADAEKAAIKTQEDTKIAEKNRIGWGTAAGIATGASGMMGLAGLLHDWTTPPARLEDIDSRFTTPTAQDSIVTQYPQKRNGDMIGSYYKAQKGISLEELQGIVNKSDYHNTTNPNAPLQLMAPHDPGLIPIENKPLSNELAPIHKYSYNKPKSNWADDAMMVGREILPYVRPSDTEQLDPKQLAGEMYAMSTNQLEPVQAMGYQPQLTTPYDISLQDQIASVDAQSRAAIRAAGSNPAAQAQIMAQANDAKNKILGEQFRMNQSQKAQVYGKNIEDVNKAKLINMDILDKQYSRQAEAKANTKAVTQAALNSIADKFAKNKLENRQLKTYENLYNYRYDENGHLVNMNAPEQFNTNVNTTANSAQNRIEADKAELKAYRDAETARLKEAAGKLKKRNGSIVKALKNL